MTKSSYKIPWITLIEEIILFVLFDEPQGNISEG